MLFGEKKDNLSQRDNRRHLQINAFNCVELVHDES